MILWRPSVQFCCWRFVPQWLHLSLRAARRQLIRYRLLGRIESVEWIRHISRMAIFARLRKFISIVAENKYRQIGFSVGNFQTQMKLEFIQITNGVSDFF